MDDGAITKATEAGYPAGEYSGEYLEVDPQAEKRLVRKLDFHIIPIVMLLYLFSFLDRYVTPSSPLRKFSVLSYV